MSRLDELLDMRNRIDEEIELEARQLRAMGTLRDDVEDLLASWSAPTRGTLVAVAEEFGVPVMALLEKNQKTEVLHARHVASWLLRDQGLSYPTIGRLMGGRDHSTAMNSCRRVNASAYLVGVADRVKARLLDARHDPLHGAGQGALVGVASSHHVKGQ